MRELMKVVSNLNYEIYLNSKDSREFSNSSSLMITSDGNSMWIEFLGETIWNSDNDLRRYNEQTDLYEDLELYLKRCIRQKLNFISLFL